jgi:PIN domain nuclease of toxin-antitoxin system
MTAMGRFWPERVESGHGQRRMTRPHNRPDTWPHQPAERSTRNPLPAGEHAVAIDGIPSFHKDPFDRMLIAQSIVEGITLLTTDKIVAQYGGTIQKV